MTISCNSVCHTLNAMQCIAYYFAKVIGNFTIGYIAGGMTVHTIYGIINGNHTFLDTHDVVFIVVSIDVGCQIVILLFVARTITCIYNELINTVLNIIEGLVEIESGITLCSIDSLRILTGCIG